MVMKLLCITDLICVFCHWCLLWFHHQYLTILCHYIPNSDIYVRGVSWVAACQSDNTWQFIMPTLCSLHEKWSDQSPNLSVRFNLLLQVLTWSLLCLTHALVALLHTSQRKLTLIFQSSLIYVHTASPSLISFSFLLLSTHHQPIHLSHPPSLYLYGNNRSLDISRILETAAPALLGRVLYPIASLMYI